VKRPPRSGRGGRQADGTAERKDGDDSEEEAGNSVDGGTARVKDDEKEDESSDYTSNSTSDDDTPPDAAVYSFVPPHSNHTAASSQHTKPAPGTNKPALPASLHEQSLLVVKQRSTQQRDELDDLLHMDEGKSGGGGGMADRTASVTDGRGDKVTGNELHTLEDELDSLLSV